LKSFIDGSFTENVDFEFELGGKVLDKLWLLVDGIYPECSRFAKTIEEPIVPNKRMYSRWQEGCRKDVERAFGVVRRKFQVLKRPLEWWFLNDIKQIVETCIILHNMMVEVRITRDEQEDSNLYFYDLDESINERIIDKVSEDVERAQAELDLIRRMDAEYYDGEAINMTEIEDDNKKAFFSFHHKCCLKRWSNLYDAEEFHKLRTAIIDQLVMNRDQEQYTTQQH
jgi:hypothetical protein